MSCFYRLVRICSQSFTLQAAITRDWKHCGGWEVAHWGCLGCPFTAVLASNGVFSKASDTQFIIIVENDTMVYITYPKFNDAVVHQIPERYYGIHNVPKILLWYIITKYHHMIPRYLKENQAPLITSWQFFIYLFFVFSFAC